MSNSAGGRLAVMLGSFAVLWAGESALGGIVAGVILLDLGMQMTHVSNQARTYSLRPDAPNRLNSVYMVSCCIGAGVGSLIGGAAWSGRAGAGSASPAA